MNSAACWRPLLAALTIVAACKGSDKSTDEASNKKPEKSAKGPADLDVESIVDDVKCKKSDDPNGCVCLRDFKSAKTFDDLPTRARRRGWAAPMRSAGQFKPGKGNVRVLFPENDDEEADAKSLVKAASAGEKAPRTARQRSSSRPRSPPADITTSRRPRGVAQARRRRGHRVPARGRRPTPRRRVRRRRDLDDVQGSETDGEGLLQ